MGREQPERRGHVSLRAGEHHTGDRLTAPEPVVFVVDDDASVRRGLRRLLVSAGYHVRVFASGDELLADAAAGDAGPCCFVLDVRMPGRSGLALHEALLAAGFQCPVVFITGDGEIPLGSRGVGSTSVTVLAKPVDDGDLLDAIQRMVARPDGAGAC